jgi:hypothetical protein
MLELNFDHLNDENYNNWKTYMEAMLVQKGLWPIVSGSERHPGGSEGTKKVRDFRTRLSYTRAEITLHVEPFQLAHCSHNDPMIIWNTLADVHSPRGCSTIITLCCRLHKLHLEQNEAMATYSGSNNCPNVSHFLNVPLVTQSEDYIILSNKYIYK